MRREDNQRISRAYIKYFGLDTVFKEKSINEFILNKDFANISGGECQKISIVRLLLKNCDIMIFDEPTASLDEKSKKKFYHLINEIKHDKIIIVVSHDAELKENVDFVIRIGDEGFEG